MIDKTPDETAKKSNSKVAICHRLREVFLCFHPRYMLDFYPASTCIRAVTLLHFYDIRENVNYIHVLTATPRTVHPYM